MYLIYFIFLFASLDAGPSSLFWTNCTTEVYDKGQGHVNVDNYFTVTTKNQTCFNPMAGFTLGFFKYKEINGEVGVDYSGGTDNFWIFNMGFGIEEDKLFNGAPSAKIGTFNVGDHQGNVVDIILGRSFLGGNLYIGGFTANKDLGKDQNGFMVGFKREFLEKKWFINLDYASGKNIIGGGSLGIGYNFAPGMDLLTGPVWFNSRKYCGPWMWGIQLGVEFPVF